MAEKKETYSLTVAGLKRELTLCPVDEKLDIAAFIMFSDVELTVRAAEELLKIAPEHDVLITAESKGIPLAYEMSRQSGRRYLLARKSKKLYMKNTVEVTVRSITTDRLQQLFLDEEDMRYLKGKRVLLVDDVISTGESIHALEQLVGQAGGIVAGKACVLAEGAAAERKDILFLAPLPLFFKD
ncbi:MAG: adenine phosphoribosyltransferase [Oscillospiraceae bacterium]|jgi:adenine phosphoribosyltransferase|nr:adenine phosphoribosyltransferase [Oscillospiraceae bacterium]